LQAAGAQMSELQIKKASRSAMKIKVLLTGPSGSGKTMSSLLFAHGLVPGGKILVIDTEDGSSNLYADHADLRGIEYDVVEIKAPYLIAKYSKALELGRDQKYDVIIVDSISHAWAGEGGLLDKKQSLDSRPNTNSFTNWASVSKEHEHFKSLIIHSSSHIVATARSKQDYVVEQNDKGKSVPRKVGLAPIQREGIEYEFTTVFDIGMDHQFAVSKDRTGLFDGIIKKMDVSTGAQFSAWLKGAKPEIIEQPKPQASNDSNEVKARDAISQEIVKVMESAGLTWDAAILFSKKEFKKSNLKMLSISEMQTLLEYFVSLAQKESEKFGEISF
jgi:hypothetical protein